MFELIGSAGPGRESSGIPDENQATIQAFFIFQLLGGILFIIITLVAAFARSVYRHGSWYSFCLSWIMYCFSYALLVFTTSPTSPQLGLCTFQVSLIYAAPVVASSATVALVLHLLYEVLSTIYGPVAGSTGPILIFLLIAIPWLSWAVIFFGVLGIAVSNPTQVQFTFFYCSMANNTLSKLSAIWSLVAATVVILAEIAICVIVYKNKSKKLKMGTATSMIIRVGIFTLTGMSALMAALLFTTTGGEGSRNNLILAILPALTAAIFGSQSDLIRLFIPCVGERKKEVDAKRESFVSSEELHGMTMSIASKYEYQSGRGRDQV